MPVRLESGRFWRGDQEITLRPKSFDLLRYFYANPGRVIALDEIRESVWPGIQVTSQAITNIIYELRQLLEPQDTIQIVRRRGYQLLQSSAADGELDKPNSPTLGGSLVGRDRELQRLHSLWRLASAGERQVVLLSGEAGIGKTGLAEHFLGTLDNEAVILQARCVQRYGEDEPYLPILEALERLPGFDASLLRQYAPTFLVQLPWLVAPSEHDDLREQLRGTAPGRMAREGARLFEAIAQQQPLLILIEDLHWADPATFDLLATLSAQTTTARLLVLLTFRPLATVVGTHHARSFVTAARRSRRAAVIDLAPLGPLALRAFLSQRFGNAKIAEEIAPLLEEKSGGVPLFMHAMVDHLIARGWLAERTGDWQLSADLHSIDVGIPDSLREMIDEQLAGLTENQKALLEAASAIGFEFSTRELTAATAGNETFEAEEQIEIQIEELATDGRFVRHTGDNAWPDGRLAACYRFSHALYQQAFNQHLRPQRRQQLHRRIRECLENAYAGRLSDVAARLAVHSEIAGDHLLLAHYLELAAAHAMQHYAHDSTIDYLDKAIVAIQKLPAGVERSRREINRLLEKGNLLTVARGYGAPAVSESYTRALELANEIGDNELAFRAHLGRCLNAIMRPSAAALETALEEVAQLLDIARSRPDLAAAAHLYRAFVAHSCADFEAGVAHAFAGLEAMAVAADGIPVAVDLLSNLHMILSLCATPLGRDFEAREHRRKAAAHNPRVATQYVQTTTFSHLAMAATLMNDLDDAIMLSERAIEAGVQSGRDEYILTARSLREIALRRTDRESLSALAGLLQARELAGVGWNQPILLAWLAEIHCGRGNIATARATIAAALAAPQENLYHSEVHRIQGEILHAAAKAAGRAGERETNLAIADRALRESLKVALKQRAKLFERRARSALKALG